MISRHLQTSHDKMEMKDYFRRFILEDLLLRKAHGIRDTETVRLDGMNLGVKNDYRKWLRQMPINCRMCKPGEKSRQQYFSLIQLDVHLKKCHETMTREAYEVKYGGYWKPEKKKFHPCQPCGGKLILQISDKLTHNTNSGINHEN